LGTAVELRRLLDPQRVLDREIDRVARASDASVYRLVPRAVVRPKDVGEVRALFSWARRRRRHLTFRAAGTSLSGQAISDDVLVELGPFWRAFRVLDGGTRVWSQPGVVGARLNRVLRLARRRLGPDPASIDAAMLGGILSNNASGMCCGVLQNSYHTLEALTCVLADGSVVDSALPDADERLRQAAPATHAGLLRLRDDLERNTALAALVRSKFSRKNTTGYSLNALLDFPRPSEMLARLMIGAEGTLGFIADATLRTVPDPPHRATSLVVFDSLGAAGDAVSALAAAGAAALEVLDAASLRAIREELPGGPVLAPHGAALLVELQAESPAALDAAVDGAQAVLRGLTGDRGPRFTRDLRERARLWRLRKGLAAATGAARPPGTAFVTEDVAVPVEHLAAAIRDFQELFAGLGLPETAIFGHAKDGNLHFVLSEDLRRPEAVARYDALLRGLVELVGRYGGALKAEHGSGRNMAPFVRAEWGEEAWELMWRLKRLLDPDGILNPGVVLSRDPQIHLRGLKPVPEVSPIVDRCIECGYCEAVCPSRELTLTPRQRIAVLRALEAGGSHQIRDALRAEFAWDGVATCIGDGSCETACPVAIDTGALMAELRAASRSGAARWLAARAAGGFGFSTALVRLALRVGRAAGLALPSPAARLPRPAPGRGRPRVVYFPSCLSRCVGEEPGVLPRARALLEVLDHAGFDVVYPAGAGGLCCGLAFESKGFPDAAGAVRGRTLGALERAAVGALGVVTDASPCALALRAHGVADFPDFWAREALARLPEPRRLPGRLVLHPVCSTTRSGGIEALLRVARAHAEELALPEAAGCCGFAGDRGFWLPQLTRSAARDEGAEVRQLGGARHVSTTRSCEIAMGRASGRRYISLVHVVRESLLG
jgi:D-lactate dehydrogenase